MKVTWNSDSYAQFLDPVFSKIPGLKDSLLSDFIAFKGLGTFPDILGKDGPYTAPGDIVSSRVSTFISCSPRQNEAVLAKGTTAPAIVYWFIHSMQSFRISTAY